MREIEFLDGLVEIVPCRGRKALDVFSAWREIEVCFENILFGKAEIEVERAGYLSEFSGNRARAEAVLEAGELHRDGRRAHAPVLFHVGFPSGLEKGRGVDSDVSVEIAVFLQQHGFEEFRGEARDIFPVTEFFIRRKKYAEKVSVPVEPGS